MTDDGAVDEFGPVLEGTAPSDYERYLRTDELLALQKEPEEMAHRDELLFQTVHQSSELWLKHVCFEIEGATALVGEGDIGGATRLVHRAVHGVRLIDAQLEMLTHMSPWEYQQIRRVLGHGSGFDSPGFNLTKEVSPKLGEAFLATLHAEDLGVVELYQRGREFEDFYQLAEALVDWDASVSLWRSHHLKIVERSIGAHVVGTQGTPVELLAHLHEHQFYPQLWAARTTLTEIAKLDD